MSEDNETYAEIVEAHEAMVEAVRGSKKNTSPELKVHKNDILIVTATYGVGLALDAAVGDTRRFTVRFRILESGASTISTIEDTLVLLFKDNFAAIFSEWVRFVKLTYKFVSNPKEPHHIPLSNVTGLLSEQAPLVFSYVGSL